MKRILDSIYKTIIDLVGPAPSIKTYADLDSESVDLEIGKAQLQYVYMVGVAEQRAKRNGTTFFTEYRRINKGIKDSKKVEDRLALMEFNNSSLPILTDRSRSLWDRIGIDFETNQPKYKHREIPYSTIQKFRKRGNLIAPLSITISYEDY